MTNENTINVNMENLTTEERTQLIALIEKANKSQKESELWKPDNNENYWFIYADGYTSVVRNKNCTTDEKAFAIGNYFRTKEEAEFMVERLKVLQELRELADGYKFNVGVANYRLIYNYRKQKIECEGYFFTLADYIHFESKESAQNAIDTIGEKRLKKYYFCIED